jgi:hypothetical protein
MKLQGNLLIPEAKLTHYLLVFRDQDDKSKFLAQAGFTRDNPEQLNQALIQLVQTYDAIEDRWNKYGTFYRVEGNLIGITGILAIVTIWLKRTQDETIQFITLKPKK